MTRRKPLALDVFCGVGGMALGFEQAGFRVLTAVDAEQRHVDSYAKNFPQTKTIRADLRKLTGRRLLEESGLEEGPPPDVLFGGPPCQGFSAGGKRIAADARNSLVFEFLRLLRETEANYFVMENVEGFMFRGVKELRDSFFRRARRAGYQVAPLQVLNAADYGVPQRRKRVFILGCKSDLELPKYPNPCGLFDGGGREILPTVWDAIRDLPDLDQECVHEDGSFLGSLGAPSYYGKVLRGEAVDRPDHSRRRPRPESLTGCYRTQHSQQVIERFSQTPLGSREPISRFFRLDKMGLSPTLRAGTGVSHGSHTAPRPIHPVYSRCITPREAARLHSFPDWFTFHATRWHALMQIGNSVPPMLAKRVAAEVRKAIHKND